MGFGSSSGPDNRPPEFVREALFDQFQAFQPFFDERMANPLTQQQSQALGDYRGALGQQMGPNSLQGQAAANFGNFVNGQGVLDSNVRGFGQQLTAGGVTNPAAARASQLASSQAINPYLDQQFAAASSGLRDQFENAVSGIRGNAALSGLRGSTALGNAVDDAETGLARGLADLSANIYSQGYENAANRQLQATGLEGQLGQQAIANRIAGANVLDQGTQRQIQASQVAPSIANAQLQPFQTALGLADYESAAQFAPFEQYQSLINPGLGVANFDRGGGNGSIASNALGGAAGGALIGLQAGGPGGALIGGGLGAIGGLFS